MEKTATKYNWSFPFFDTAVLYKGRGDVVTAIHWKLTASDGMNSGSCTGICQLPPPSVLPEVAADQAGYAPGDGRVPLVPVQAPVLTAEQIANGDTINSVGQRVSKTGVVVGPAVTNTNAPGQPGFNPSPVAAALPADDYIPFNRLTAKWAEDMVVAHDKELGDKKTAMEAAMVAEVMPRIVQRVPGFPQLVAA